MIYEVVRVALLVSAWIEINMLVSLFQLGYVALLVSAWIEILEMIVITF